MLNTKVNPSSSSVNTRRTQPHTSTLMASAAINISSSTPVEKIQITTQPELGQLVVQNTETFKHMGWKAFMEQRHIKSDFVSLDNMYHPA